MDLVDVADGVRVDPNEGDNMEEISAFVVVRRFAEDSILHILKQGVHQLIELFKGLVIVLFQGHIDDFEKLKRVVQYLVVSCLKVTSTDLKDAAHKGLEIHSAHLHHMIP